ncbi:hypothetical protein L1887_06497 [Cichorium endivia]|nr:hypothetical protein L1887_06497 [Cichorium endivia]
MFDGLCVVFKVIGNILDMFLVFGFEFNDFLEVEGEQPFQRRQQVTSEIVVVKVKYFKKLKARELRQEGGNNCLTPSKTRPTVSKLADATRQQKNISVDLSNSSTPFYTDRHLNPFDFSSLNI